MSKNPFDFINSISYTKEDILEEEKDFPSFLVVRGLSYFIDTILYANEININPNIDNRMKYDYLIHSIRKKKRFSKWAKKETSDNLKLIMDRYGYSEEKAYSIMDLFTEKDFEEISYSMRKGGR